MTKPAVQRRADSAIKAVQARSAVCIANKTASIETYEFFMSMFHICHYGIYKEFLGVYPLSDIQETHVSQM
jgi:Holliday junction resolvasome RuvABC endonuclease subunit